jgi:hypothetical protein
MAANFPIRISLDLAPRGIVKMVVIQQIFKFRTLYHQYLRNPILYLTRDDKAKGFTWTSVHVSYLLFLLDVTVVNSWGY